MTAFYSWLARTATRRRWWFIGAWIVVLVVAGVAAGQADAAMKVGGFNLPGTEFNLASNYLKDDLDISSDKAALVVYHSDTLRVSDKAFHDEVMRGTDALKQQPYVAKVDTFYSEGIPDLVSPNNHTTYALVTLQGSEDKLEQETPTIRRLVHSDVIEAEVIGNSAANYDIEKASADDLVRVERFTLPIVFLLLVLVFGSLVAAGVPIVLGIFGVVSSLAVLWVVSQFTDISIFALNTASMIGLGLAIDFSLIMVSRFREELAGHDLETALERTLQTAGRSITFSGITLMLTMLVLTLFPIMVIRSIALAIVIVAAVSILVGLLLLPALLAVISPWINSLNLRRHIPFLNRDREGFWHSWAMRVMGRPWVSLALGLLILGIIATPALWLKRSGVTVEVLPKSSESRRAMELVQREFGPGEATPILLVVHTAQPGGIWQQDVLTGIYDLHEKLKADPRVDGVRSLASLIPNPSADWIRSLSPATIETNKDRTRIAKRLVNLEQPDGGPGGNNTTVLIVTPRYKDTDDHTVALLKDIRAHATDWAPGLSSAQVLAGGTPAQHYDFDRVVYDQVPLLVFLSLLVSFVILMLFFHSLVLPIKAILLNLISILAAYGVLVFIFQFGVGDFLIRLDSIGAILSYTPVLLFAILFGLSTDYEVFLLTRVREAHLHGASNEESVAIGLERTAGIITAAGLIMIAVFGSFALTQVLVVKEIGFGLAVAVLLDTTLVRLVLVPATMKLMGERNWWMPRALDRVVPEIDEGDVAPAVPAAGTVTGG